MLRPWLSSFLIWLLALTPLAAQEFFPTAGPLLGAAGSIPQPANAFVGCTDSTSTASTQTHATVPIGTAYPTRVIVAAVGGEDNASTFSIDNVTFDGNAGAEQVEGTEGGPNVMRVAIWTRAMPTGTTSSIAITFSESVNQGSFVCIWALYDASATATDTADGDQGVAGALTLDTDNSAGGILVGQCGNSTDTATHTWTGLTEINDVDAGTTYNRSSAQSTSTGTPVAITATNTAGNLWCVVAAFN